METAAHTLFWSKNSQTNYDAMSNASSNTPDLVPSNLPSAEEDRVRSSISEDIISGLSFIFEEVMWDLWTLKYKLLFKFFPSLRRYYVHRTYTAIFEC